MHRMLGFLVIFYHVCVSACTGVQVRASDQTFVNGRTVDFDTQLPMTVIVTPRNHIFSIGDLPVQEASYVSKYAAVGICCFNDLLILDGMNEMGLSIGAFYFAGYADYMDPDEITDKMALSPIDFPNWVLTQFATVDEVIAGMDGIAIASIALDSWGFISPPMHYVVYDRAGRSIVIEPTDKKLKIYENPLGVMTNAPGFDWHMINLQNYVNLGPTNVESHALGNIELAPLGQGSGMLGLPADFTPPSRFVRAAFYSANIQSPRNHHGAVRQTFHILNQFDYPEGTIRRKEKDHEFSTKTLIATVKDPESSRFFFRTFDHFGLKYVDLKEFDLDGPDIRKLRIEGEEAATNISSLLR